MAVDIDVSKVFKTFMIIDENYKCPANCPFCTAKITKWEKTNHDWDCLGKQLEFLNSMNMKFENLTVSGNGEPCILDIDILTNIKNQFLKYQNMFEYGRIQTCGELFNLNDKWELFKDFCFEITRCDIDPIRNAEILGYKPYDDLVNFKNSKIMFNLALLKENNHKTVEDLSLKKIEDVETTFCDDGFELRLTLDKYSIYQEYDIVDGEIILLGTYKE